MRRTSLVSVLVMLGLALVVIVPASAQTGPGTGASPTGSPPAGGGGLLSAGQSFRLSQLLDMPVRFVGGGEAGHLDNLAVDLNTGEVVCAVVAPRFPLVEAEKLYPVPFSALRYNGRDALFELDGDARALQRAPRLDRYGSQPVSLAGVCSAAQTFWEREPVRALVTPAPRYGCRPYGNAGCSGCHRHSGRYPGSGPLRQARQRLLRQALRLQPAHPQSQALRPLHRRLRRDPRRVRSGYHTARDAGGRECSWSAWGACPGARYCAGGLYAAGQN